MSSIAVRRKICPLLGLFLAVPAAIGQSAQIAPAKPAVLEIQTEKTLHSVSPTLYGLMTEEINYSYDGGLYPELVRNRALRDEGWEQQDWTLLQNKVAGAEMVMDKTTGPSAALTNSLKLTIKAASATEPVGVRNKGFWGYALKPNTTYSVSFYAKGDVGGGQMWPLKVSLVNDKTGKPVATATTPVGGDWKQYQLTLKTGAIPTGTDNHLELTAISTGTLWLDLVSVFPPTYKDRPNGFRIDLMEKMAGMHPAFLRFPGGNYLEGDHIAERYDWKKTIGPLVDRPTHPSPWSYHSSDGLGLLEFLEWCEDLHANAVLAVYAGYSMRQEHVDPGTALDPYVQDALDEIEYATGGPETKWGAERAKDGHPAPFTVSYVEIGNEDFFDRSKSYDGRFKQFHDAIKAKYPSLQLIATTPVTGVVPDVVDDHYYKSAEEFFDDTHHYDKADRGGSKIFVGEYATMEGSPTADFGAALGDAAWLTGIERNSDLIVMSAYAPMFVNVNPGGMQWHPDLIGYDGLTSYGSPSYYALSLFAGYLGDQVPDSTLTGAGPRFFYSVTRQQSTGMVYLKLVNASPAPQDLEIKLDKASGAVGKLLRLHAETQADTNSIANPKHIVPVESPLPLAGPSLHHTIPGFSIEVLEFPGKK